MLKNRNFPSNALTIPLGKLEALSRAPCVTIAIFIMKTIVHYYIEEGPDELMSRGLLQSKL